MELSRRGFLRIAGVGAGVSLLLEACSSAQPAQPTPAQTVAGNTGAPANGPLPTYLAPTNGPKPDFHSTDPRITDGFANFPKEPVKSWNGGTPSSNGTLNVLVPAYYPVPTAR